MSAGTNIACPLVVCAEAGDMCILIQPLPHTSAFRKINDASLGLIYRLIASHLPTQTNSLSGAKGGAGKPRGPMWVQRMAVRASLAWVVVAAMTLLSTARAAVWSVSDAAGLRAAMEAAANEDVISITRDVSFDDANADSTLSHLVLPADSEAHMKNLTFEGD
jgi:hypothetical protein